MNRVLVKREHQTSGHADVFAPETGSGRLRELIPLPSLGFQYFAIALVTIIRSSRITTTQPTSA